MSTTSSTSRTRATNLTGLIDIDALVEANLLRQKTKLNTATQKMKVEEYKQEQYREVITKSKTFWNKYCDILSGDNLLSSSNYNSMKATSSDSSSVTATASTKANSSSYKVQVTQVATAAQYTISASDLTSGSKISILGANGKAHEFTLEGEKASNIAENLNKSITDYNSNENNKDNKINVTASFSSFVNDKNGNGGLLLQTNDKGASQNITVEFNGKQELRTGQDSIAEITDLTTNLSKTVTTSGNSVKLDEVTFDFIDKTTSPVTINVKPDGTELKDKIVEFINDYNELLGHINGKLYETYDRSYLPLTDDDKEGLSDSEIEKLEKKAQTGLLRNDSYLSSFADDMKLTMTTMLEGSGLSLEKMGIKPVNDYSTKNGLFTIDEDKLLEAIEENQDGIKELFSGKNGIITKLNDNLKEHATGTFSRLANKAGVADSVTANTNEMTKDIEQRKKLIAQMQTALQEKEDALYTKYASLESSLSSLQSQQSSLSSYFQ
ncbi:flagellar filament capping protein FliD [Clostridium neonatale]|uniref:flagellar filament capping protein FliD n=1 Tax=Clostridium neonatale TaxID=137838 RepID=UPI003A2F5AB2